MVRTQIQLTEEQARQVRRIAQQEGVSMAEMIRRYVNRGLEDARPSRTELWDQALSAVGKFVDQKGAEDVAERHDDYLDGIYG